MECMVGFLFVFFKMGEVRPCSGAGGRVEVE